MENFFEIGIITSPSGLKGEVRVYPTTDDPSRFNALIGETVFADVARALSSARFQKNMAVIKLDGIDSVEEAEKLKGLPLRIPPNLALPLEEGQYYHRDLLGMSVISEDGGQLGVLARIISTGANDVYVITKPDGAELLIPAIRQCILSADTVGKVMTVRLLPGLAEL